MPRDAVTREYPPPLPADLLGLAAAPTFAAMALVTATHGGSGADPLCTAPPDGLPLSGMGAMYALMAVFHSAPWLRRFAATRDRVPITPKGEPR
jgi:hypothetical protein